MSLLLAQSRRVTRAGKCPLIGAKQTWRRHRGTTPGHWVIGVLLNNQWSVGGDPLRPAVNTFLGQPFINYNMTHGWYLTTSPIITSNWLAAPGQQWTVPIGGGFGRVFKVGDQPVNAQRLITKAWGETPAGGAGQDVR